MQGIVKIQLLQFLTVYLLLLIVLFIMKKAKVSETRLLFTACLRMTVQLAAAGYLLTYIFKKPNPAVTVLYVAAMLCFAVYRVIKPNKKLNRRFKLAIALSLCFSGVAVLLFMIIAVIGESPFNPQYVIPLGGMIIGNTMTGVSLAVKTFLDSFSGQRLKIETLLNMGAEPKKILMPFVNRAFETAILPTLNSMLGMGLVSLPGMMTGQILSGTVPTTAILYQIAIMICICTAVCVAVFSSLYIGCRTMYNSRKQILFISEK